MNAVIRVSNLTKEFKDVRAVDGLSFTVEEGQVYGFLGQNGAGKSTTIRMLLTLIKPTSGQIEIFGLDLKRHRSEILQRIGAIIERPDLYKYMTGLENMRVFAAMSRVKLSDIQLLSQLEKVGLGDRATSRVKTYSQGMKQRLGIAIALVHDPNLIILDEPTNGLDPQGIADIRRLILHLSKDLGKTMLISSHLLSEIELVADSMLIIDKGRKVIEGKVNELFDPSGTMVEMKTTDDEKAFEKMKESGLAKYLYQKRNDCIILKLHREELAKVMKELVAMDISVLSFSSRHSLEDYFLSLTTGQNNVDAIKN